MALENTSADLFFTRLAAHLCAPVFVFLTGLSAWLYANPPGRPSRSASAFLAKRGLLLIALEVTLVNFSWFGAYHTLYLQVIWAIGVSMLSLAALIQLPRLWLAVVGFAIVLGHNALSPIEFSANEAGYWLWTLLHDRGYLIEEGLIRLKASYPVLPWIGVIALGYLLGPLFHPKITPKQRLKGLVAAGLTCLGSLLLLRGFNIYGETLAWQPQATGLLSVMDFLNFTKYPPSLHFLLLTLGIGLLLLALFERFSNRLTQVLCTFGSAPMFFYIIHLYVLLGLYLLAEALFGTNQGAYFGFSHLWQIWLATLLLALLFYFPTRAFGQYKQSRRARWTHYF